MHIRRGVRPIVATALVLRVVLSAGAAQGRDVADDVPVNPAREVYYGDLHLHTSYSFDAFVAGTAVDPDAAYRFAKGEAIEYLGQSIQRRESLDFLAVSDHAESIGIFSRLGDSQSTMAQSQIGKAMKAYLSGTRGTWPTEPPPSALRSVFQGWPSAKIVLPDNLKAESASAWKRLIDFANRHYKPGKFTTFIAYEWTPQPNGFDYHRNVIFKGSTAPLPFSAADSNRPEDLWAWLERMRDRGHEALAIPHNSNTSNGLMYQWIDSDGEPIDAVYASKRQANEPLSEISQKRGASEVHPLLSPNDEFASHEIFASLPGAPSSSRPAGSYLRDALSRGLILQRKLNVNPYKYGFVGGSDLHSGLSVSAQADFGGNTWSVNMGSGKPTRDEVDRMLTQRDRVLWYNSGSLTGVWAESNTRESIYNALRRKETFATSGTKLKMRFFGGWNFDGELWKEKENWIAKAYANGVPMGSDLPAKPSVAKSPTFAIWIVKDPKGANLDRVQVIKVWEEDGQQKETVFDVAWAGNRKPNIETRKVPAIGSTVDLKTGNYTNTIGSVVLEAVWEDPEFNPRLYSAYYLRVLEIPTPRWSTLLAVQSELPLSADVSATIQQRGWSSPIWYVPQRQ